MKSKKSTKEKTVVMRVPVSLARIIKQEKAKCNKRIKRRLSRKKRRIKNVNNR